MLSRYSESIQRHPKVAAVGSIVGLLCTVIGAAGIPEDLKAWGGFLESLGGDDVRWLFVLVGVVMMVVCLLVPWVMTKWGSGAPAQARETTRVAVGVELANAGGEARALHAMLDAERPYITPKGQDLEEAIPDWRAKTIEFITVALGPIQCVAFTNVGIGKRDVLDQLKAEDEFLCDLSRNLTLDSIRATEAEVLAARKTRRESRAAEFFDYDHFRAPGAPPPANLASQIDSLMREGLDDLMPALGEPVKPERTKRGEWKISGGSAPKEWWDKAEDFFHKAQSLLKERQPALLKDFERGFNEQLSERRDRRNGADAATDTRSTAEKMLDFANSERSTPREIVEATLSGLTEARRRVGTESLSI